jgi:hypothetical protein
MCRFVNVTCACVVCEERKVNVYRNMDIGESMAGPTSWHLTVDTDCKNSVWCACVCSTCVVSLMSTCFVSMLPFCFLF